MPNLLNPTNDPRIDEQLRRMMQRGGLLFSDIAADVTAPGGAQNIEKSALAGLLGQFGDYAELARPFQVVQTPERTLPTSEEVAPKVGADLSRPTGFMGLLGLPDVTDIGRLAAAAPLAVKKGKGLVSRPDPLDVPIGNITTPGAKVSDQARRVGTTGQYRGAPRGTASPQKLGALRNKLKGALERGVEGRFWYDRSSQAARDLTGDLPGRTQRYAGNIAVTSADTAVPSNAGFAIKGFNQGAVGDDIVTGRYPQRMGQNIGTITRGEDIALTDKVGPFFEANTLDLSNAKDIRPTNDLWMARAFGYTQKDKKTGKFVEWSSGLGEAQHRFMDEEINSLVELANKQKIGGFDDWTPERVQASIWVSTKAEREGTSVAQAATDFATGLPARTVSIASESTPAASLNHMQGLMDAPGGKERLFDAQNSLLTNDAGQDVVALHAGALTRPSVTGSGVYGGEINPVTKTQILGGTQTGSQNIDPASRKLADAIGGTHGLLKGQETTAVKFLRKADKAGLRNSARVELGRPASADELTRLEAALKREFGDDVAIPDFHESGVDILGINLDESGSLLMPTKDFQTTVGKIVEDELGVKLRAADFMDNTAARTGQGPAPGLLGEFGEYKPSAHLKAIDSAGPEVAENLDPLVRWAGEALEDVDANLAASIPDPGSRSKILQMTREALSEGGLDRVRELVKQGVLPAVVLGVFAGASAQPAPFDDQA